MDFVRGLTAQTFPLVLFGGLFLTVGIWMAINIALGLATGGPRDRFRPEKPYLFDRVYYLMLLSMWIGWTVALLSFDQAVATKEDSSASNGFLVGWGIMAIGIGLLYRFRFNMMEKASAYLSKNGFVLFRPFHVLRLQQFRGQPLVQKFLPMAFLVVGIGVLGFNLPHIAEVPEEVALGAKVLLGQINGLL